MEPVIVYNVLTSISLLANVVETLSEKCVVGITANRDHCLAHLERSTAMATSLVPELWYDQSAEIAREMLSNGRSIHEVLQNRGLALPVSMRAGSDELV